ncbi:type II secretion system protein J [Agaribacter flavus]|uniref:Type II secretion system protein J n=1 Tax=Agaribacter flavus TaxID=1902781 RepID=A0ABV7FRH2_9ALTE
MRKSMGFSLIESLVALVVLSIVISLLSEWVSNAQRASVRVNQQLKLEDTLEQAIAYLESVEFKKQREGSFQIQEIVIRWRSTILRQSKNEYYRRQPAWNVVLFNVDLSFYIDNREVASVTTAMTKQWLEQ